MTTTVRGSILVSGGIQLSNDDSGSSSIIIENGLVQTDVSLNYRDDGMGDTVSVTGSGVLRIANSLLLNVATMAGTFNSLEVQGGECQVTTNNLRAGPTSRLIFSPDDSTGQCAIEVSNMVTLDGAFLVVQVGSKKRAPIVSASTHGDLTIIDNLGSNPVVGEFSGLGEGDTAVVFGDGTSYLITYVGGDGNDVQLLQDGVPAE